MTSAATSRSREIGRSQACPPFRIGSSSSSRIRGVEEEVGVPTEALAGADRIHAGHEGLRGGR